MVGEGWDKMATAFVAKTQAERAERIEELHDVKVHARLGSYAGVALDVSRTGVQLAIVDPEFEIAGEETEDDLLGLRIAAHFDGGFEVEFVAVPVRVRAQLVRMADTPGGAEGPVCFGCEFSRPLTQWEWRMVGLGEVVHEIPAAPAPPPRPGSESEPECAGGAGGSDSGASGRDSDTDPAGSTPAASVADVNDAACMDDLLAMAVSRDATDLHIKAGSPIRVRIDGELAEVSESPLAEEAAATLVREILTDEQFERFEQTGDLDCAYSLHGVARFRINVLRSRGVMGMAIRRIPEIVPTIQELGLSPACAVMAERPRGLVLVTGPTGSGKSTTLAAMVHHVNTSRACHIVTMEDPIEYIHDEVRSHITQREVGRDTMDFASALKRALRQDPDVILVGEMRDLETISLAVTAAETGHLVFATLHTTSAALTVDRIVDVFPPAQQAQIRMQLADALQGIVSQMLLPRKGRGVVVAQEILVANSAVRALIREGKSPQIANMMQTGAKDGMQTLEDAMSILLEQGAITYETAMSKANDPRRIREPGKPGPGPT